MNESAKKAIYFRVDGFSVLNEVPVAKTGLLIIHLVLVHNVRYLNYIIWCLSYNVQEQGLRSAERKEFTKVNDCFQHEYNAAIEHYRQTLFKRLQIL